MQNFWTGYWRRRADSSLQFCVSIKDSNHWIVRFLAEKKFFFVPLVPSRGALTSYVKKGPPSKFRINWLQSLLEVGGPICSLRCFPLRKTTKNAHLPCEPIRILTDPKKKIPHTIQPTLGPHFPSLKMTAFAGKVSRDRHLPHQKQSS